jgi:hypothetical protein
MQCNRIAALTIYFIGLTVIANADETVRQVLIDTNAGCFELVDPGEVVFIECNQIPKHRGRKISLRVDSSPEIDSVPQLLKSTKLKLHAYDSSFWTSCLKDIRAIENQTMLGVRCYEDRLRNAGLLVDDSGPVLLNFLAIQFEDSSCLFIRSIDLYDITEITIEAGKVTLHTKNKSNKSDFDNARQVCRDLDLSPSEQLALLFCLDYFDRVFPISSISYKPVELLGDYRSISRFHKQKNNLNAVSFNIGSRLYQPCVPQKLVFDLKDLNAFRFDFDNQHLSANYSMKEHEAKLAENISQLAICDTQTPISDNSLMGYLSYNTEIAYRQTDIVWEKECIYYTACLNAPEYIYSDNVLEPIVEVQVYFDDGSFIILPATAVSEIEYEAGEFTLHWRKGSQKLNFKSTTDFRERLKGKPGKFPALVSNLLVSTSLKNEKLTDLRQMREFKLRLGGIAALIAHTDLKRSESRAEFGFYPYESDKLRSSYLTDSARFLDEANKLIVDEALSASESTRYLSNIDTEGQAIYLDHYSRLYRAVDDSFAVRELIRLDDSTSIDTLLFALSKHFDKSKSDAGRPQNILVCVNRHCSNSSYQLLDRALNSLGIQHDVRVVTESKKN